jgi:hypothetical protein
MDVPLDTINNPQGCSADISSVSGEKAWGQKEIFGKI